MHLFFLSQDKYKFEFDSKFYKYLVLEAADSRVVVFVMSETNPLLYINKHSFCSSIYV